MTRQLRVLLPDGPRLVDATEVVMAAEGVMALTRKGPVKVSQQLAPNGQLVPVAEQETEVMLVVQAVAGRLVVLIESVQAEDQVQLPLDQVQDVTDPNSDHSYPSGTRLGTPYFGPH